jgi:energy-coupling factor transporter transmembrane protein EcfT
MLIVVISLKRVVLPEAVIFIFVFSLVALCRLNLINFYKKVLVLGFVFGFLVSAPSALNVIVPGKVIMPLVVLSRPYDFWIYHVPPTIGITQEGIPIISLLTLRVLNSLSISFLILYTTPFADIIKALKVIKVPDTFLIIISMTYKYIFTFAHIVSDMYLAKKARLACGNGRKKAREWIAGRIAFVFKKTQIECEEVFKAMNARGFSGEIRLYHHRKVTGKDWATGLCLIAAGIVCFFI